MKSKIPVGSSVFGLGDELTTMDPSTTNGIITCYGWYNNLDTPATKALRLRDAGEVRRGRDRPERTRYRHL